MKKGCLKQLCTQVECCSQGTARKYGYYYKHVLQLNGHIDRAQGDKCNLIGCGKLDIHYRAGERAKIHSNPQDVFESMKWESSL